MGFGICMTKRFHTIVLFMGFSVYVMGSNLVYLMGFGYLYSLWRFPIFSILYNQVDQGSKNKEISMKIETNVIPDRYEPSRKLFVQFSKTNNC